MKPNNTVKEVILSHEEWNKVRLWINDFFKKSVKTEEQKKKNIDIRMHKLLR